MPLRAQTLTDTLVAEYEKTTGRERIDAANRVFQLLYDNETTDSLIQYDRRANADTVEANLYYWVGEEKYFTQDFLRGADYFERALRLIGNENLGLQNDCYNELAICQARRGLFPEAIESATRCVEIGEQMGDKERLLTATNIIGATYLMAKQPAEAEKYMLRSLEIATELRDSVKMAVRYGILSEIYHNLDDNQKAVDFAREGLRLDSLRGDEARMAVRRVQLASPLFALGETAQARQLLLEALPALETSHNMVSLPICLNQLGYVQLKEQAWNEAAESFEQAISIYDKTGERFTKAKALWGLWEALRHTDLHRAADYLEAYALLKDSLYQEDVARMTADYDARYQNSELRLQNERQRQHNRMMRWMVGSIVFLLVAGVILRGVFKRLKQKNALMKQKLDLLREHLLTPADREFISHVDERLHEQFQEGKVDLEGLASDLHISRSHLNRKVKNLLDESMQEHVNNVRIAQAKQLLAESNMNISEVARACGIADVAYFSRFFRKMTGQSPTAYRKVRGER